MGSRLNQQLCGAHIDGVRSATAQTSIREANPNPRVLSVGWHVAISFRSTPHTPMFRDKPLRGKKPNGVWPRLKAKGHLRSQSDADTPTSFRRIVHRKGLSAARLAPVPELATRVCRAPVVVERKHPETSRAVQFTSVATQWLISMLEGLELEPILAAARGLAASGVHVAVGVRA